MAFERDGSELSIAIRDVMARAAPTYGRIGPDFFSMAAEGLVRQAGLAPVGRVLDVGCGPGTVLATLRRHLGSGATLVGVDIVPEMVVRARERLGRGVDLAVMDATALSLSDSTFDAVMCAATIYQVADGTRATAEMVRVLRPAGLLGLSVFDASDRRWDGLSKLYEKHMPSLPDVGRSYDGGMLKDLMQGAGLVQIRVVHQRLDIPYADAAEWLANAWSHGERRAFEAMDPTSYRAFVEGLPASLEPAREEDGRLHWRPNAIYAFGSRPA